MPLQHALKCYNVITKEVDEDLRNINILESKGQREVRGPSAEILDISKPVCINPMNIGSKVAKICKHGEYWDEDTMDKVVEFIHEYQDLIPTTLFDLKGIVGDL